MGSLFAQTTEVLLAIDSKITCPKPSNSDAKINNMLLIILIIKKSLFFNQLEIGENKKISNY